MSQDSRSRLSRRRFLRAAATRLAALPVIAVVGGSLAGRQAHAAKSGKEAMQYQETPKGDQKCSNCSLFIPGDSDSTMGQCKVVKGDISPDAWCIAYAPKA